MTTTEFLATKLGEVDAQLRGAILNRRRWTALCEDRQVLRFLDGRQQAPDFSSISQELARIAEGQLRVPGLSGPRRKAADCLHNWADLLAGLD